MKKVTLYIAIHNITGKKYFGKTMKYFTKEDLQKNYHGSGTYWKNHLNKYGDDVTMEIYKICSLDEDDKDYVKNIAAKFSEENNIVESKEWANLIPENGVDGGYGMQGKFHSDKTRQKISENKTGKSSKRKGFKSSDETKRKISESKIGDKNPMYGNTHSEKTKQKMSESHTGKILSQETKCKLSESKTGTKLSDKTKNKISQSNKDRPKSEEHKMKLKQAKLNMSNETKEKMSDYAKNRTEEHRNNLSQSLKGKVKTEETKKKMSEAKKGIKHKLSTCNYCGKCGGERAMKRFHFENCKNKPTVL